MKEFVNNIKFSWKYCKSEKWKLLFYAFTIAFDGMINVVWPIWYAKIIVEITNNDFYQILLFGFVLLVIEIFSGISDRLGDIMSNKIYMNSIINVQKDLGVEVLKLENEVLEKNGTGVFIQRLSGDASNMADIFNSLTNQIGRILTYVGRFVAIFIINPFVCMYFIIACLLLGIVERIRSKKRIELDKEVRKGREKTQGFVGELVRGSKDIRMLNAEKSFLKRLEEVIIENNELLFKRNMTNTNYRTFLNVLTDLFNFIFILILIFVLSKKYVSVTDALVLWNYSGGILYFMNVFGMFVDSIKEFGLSVSRIEEIMTADTFKKETFGSKHLEHVEGNFEFDNVTFKYDKNKVLNGLSFKVKANETVAFVGRSGAGKSTIFSLLCKMYEPQKGVIRIDGENIKKLDKDSIRGNITIISQDPYIFNMSIKDNLKLVKEDLTDEEIIDACKIACLHDYIESLPDKYDTMIGEGGINLSGGQKQRLAIARALVQKTEIILFDEATSALDNETQSKIQMAIDNMKNEYTILIIAHRLSTIINADRILFINDGKVEAEGSHKELLKKCKNYKTLYETEIINRK